MSVDVVRGDVTFTCHSEEQLASFLEDGYTIAEEKAEEVKKTSSRKPRK